jgi:hypothetical protein
VQAMGLSATNKVACRKRLFAGAIKRPIILDHVVTGYSSSAVSTSSTGNIG